MNRAPRAASFFCLPTVEKWYKYPYTPWDAAFEATIQATAGFLNVSLPANLKWLAVKEGNYIESKGPVLANIAVDRFHVGNRRPAARRGVEKN